MTSVDIEQEIEDKPESLYYLCKLYIEGPQTQLPRIINREHENIFLIDRGLIEYSSEKNRHLKLTRLTEDGKNLIRSLKNKGFLSIFLDIPLNSAVDFKKYYFEKINAIKGIESSTSSTFMFKTIGNQILNIQKAKKIPMRYVYFDILDYSLKSKDKDEEIWNFKITFKCEQCSGISSNSIDINYSYNKIGGLVEIYCSQCYIQFKLCKNFGCLYMSSN